MNDEERTREINRGKRRIIKLLRDANVPKDRIVFLEPIIIETEWIKTKLQEAREEIGSAGLVVHYNNGGGQSGKRENPLFKGYEALFKTFTSGYEMILAELPKGSEEMKRIVKEKPQNALEIVRAKHKKEV